MLQLNDYYYPISSIIASPDFEPNGSKLNKFDEVDIEGGFNIDSDGFNCKAILTVSTQHEEDNDDIIPYHIEVTAIGEFTSDKKLSKNGINKHETIFAFSILYTSIREHIMAITSRGPWGPCLLPIHTFKADSLSIDTEHT